MAHIKKSNMPKTWPIRKKGSRFVSKPTHSLSKGISLLFVLRDMLGIAKSRKEARYMTLNGLVKVNHVIRKDEDFPVQILDTINFEESKKNYRLEIVNKKFSLKEISEEESKTKIVKIIGKKILKSGNIQMNLDDGGNILTKEDFSVGDSIILNTKDSKIEKVLPLKEGSNVEIILGKHAGKKGKLLRLENLKREKAFVIKLEDREVTLPLKTILVIK